MVTGRQPRKIMPGLITAAQLSSLSAGSGQVFSALQSAINTKVFQTAFPLLGTGLSTAQAAQQLTTFQSGITQALTTLASTDRTETAVESALNSQLLTMGFTGLTVDADFANTSDLKLNFLFTKNNTFTSQLANDLGLPGMNFNVTGSGTVNAALATTAAFGIGIDTPRASTSTPGTRTNSTSI